MANRFSSQASQKCGRICFLSRISAERGPRKSCTTLSAPGFGNGAVQSRTPILLIFSLALPSVEARGRWRERGRMPPWGSRTLLRTTRRGGNGPVMTGLSHAVGVRGRRRAGDQIGWINAKVAGNVMDPDFFEGRGCLV
jgi:hypothetical protein